jgi:hypothetical protein
MDFLTLSITAVALGIMSLVGLSAARRRSEESARLVAEAKARADARTAERNSIEVVEYADDRLFLSLAGPEVIHDKWDGRDALSDTQVATIGLIMDGYRPGIKHNEVHVSGITPMAKAGVPLAGGIFDSDNLIIVDGEAVMSTDDAWKDTVQ